MASFSQNTSQHGQSESALIPRGVLAPVTIMGCKMGVSGTTSKTPGARYASMDFQIVDGDYQKRRIFQFVADMDDTKWPEDQRIRAGGQLARAMESAGVFRPDQPQSYAGDWSLTKCVDALMAACQRGARIVIEIGVQKGAAGHEDKNVVANFLTPNPTSGGFKLYQKFMQEGPTKKPGKIAAAPPVAYQMPGAGATGGLPPAPAWAGARVAERAFDEEAPF